MVSRSASSLISHGFGLAGSDAGLWAWTRARGLGLGLLLLGSNSGSGSN